MSMDRSNYDRAVQKYNELLVKHSIRKLTDKEHQEFLDVLDKMDELEARMLRKHIAEEENDKQ